MLRQIIFVLGLALCARAHNLEQASSSRKLRGWSVGGVADTFTKTFDEGSRVIEKGKEAVDKGKEALSDPGNTLKEAVCKGKDGFFTEKWDRMDEVEDDNCGWLSDKDAVCETVWGKQQGGDEVLELNLKAGLACMACNVGCGACAQAALVAGLTQEVLEQVATLTKNIIESVSAEGTKFADKLLDDVYDFLEEFVQDMFDAFLEGDFGGKFKNKCLPGGEGFDMGVSAGVAYYGGENCVCGACLPALNAMRPWVSWYIREKKSCD
ncbi:hypothetical protein BSKO_12482 [Bryopsis sp. KO-2023]|nr:hypothetical protein BSKO_12482 [Bryopsis sp. KO-2023]